MIVYQKNKSEFLDDVFKRDIEAVILAEYTGRTGSRVSPAEIRAWKESLLSVAKVLNDESIPGDSGVAIEYHIPNSNKRIDFLLSGKNAKHADNLIVIELKQWSSVKKTEKDGVVVARYASGEGEVSLSGMFKGNQEFVLIDDQKVDRLVDTRRKNEVVSKEVKSRVSEVQLENSVLPFKRLHPRDVKPYVNSVPLFDLEVAAGHFSGEQLVGYDDMEWVQLPDTFKPSKKLFVVQVVGESMNKKIPNGAWCVFREGVVGDRSGRVVLARHRGTIDTDSGLSVTVKIYQSEKIRADEGEWRHSRIVLKPNSTDSRYRPIVLDPNEANNLEIFAELVAVLG